MAIFHIIVYVFFAWAMFRIAKNSEELSPCCDNNTIDKHIWYYIVFFTVISAIRWRVGVDCQSYIHIFKNGVDSDFETSEGLFYYIANTLHNHNIHFSIGLGICALVQILFTVKGILPAKYLLPYFAIVLFGGSSYLGMMNAVRQMMAAAIFIYAIKFILLRKPVIYIGLIIVASLIHHSALMLLPMYFIPPGWNIANKRTILVGIYFLCLIAGYTPQFQSLIKYIESVTLFLGYDNYSSVASEILNEEYTLERRAFGPMQLSYFLSGLIAIWYGKELHDKYSTKIPDFNLWYLFSTAYSCLYFLVCNVSHLMIRPILYFQLFQTIILSLLLYDMFNGKTEDKYNRNLAQTFVCIIWVALCWDIIKNTGHPFECVTYKTFLFR